MRDPCRSLHSAWSLEAFKQTYPELQLTYLPSCGLSFEGKLAFRANKAGCGPIEDSYSIRCEVNGAFPTELPRAFETGARIAAGYHKLSDNSLCLGSPLKQRVLLGDKPTLTDIVELLLVPYLYNHSYFEKNGTLPVGELRHGAAGLVDDYEQIFRVTGADACIGLLELLGLKKRIANKRPCPCGSGRRLGRCHNGVLKPLRKIESRNYFRMQCAVRGPTFTDEEGGTANVDAGFRQPSIDAG